VIAATKSQPRHLLPMLRSNCARKRPCASPTGIAVSGRTRRRVG